MGRKILFITTDQQRHDALGCTGGRFARTPVADAWARDEWDVALNDGGVYRICCDHASGRWHIEGTYD